MFDGMWEYLFIICSIGIMTLVACNNTENDNNTKTIRQVRRAWESLGYEESEVTSKLKNEIIKSIKDSVENIYISAKHISDLRDMQYPEKLADDFSEEEIRILATRYNRGLDLSLDKIKENTLYGDRILENRDMIEAALDE